MNETFQNLPVSIDALPSLTPTDFQLIEKAYRKVSFISSCIFFTILMVAGICIIYFNDFGNKPLGYGTAGGSVGLLWIGNLIFIVKAFPKKRYALREKDIIYTKGLLWATRTSIPFNRIQHVEIKQGPFERIFKLNSLKVFTAGGQTGDLVIPGLNEENALQIKEFILGKAAVEEHNS